jgi:aldehyde:ferredoxin oxidoreductase
MLDQYYALRGWTCNGVPTKERLIALRLEDVTDTMAADGCE